MIIVVKKSSNAVEYVYFEKITFSTCAATGYHFLLRNTISTSPTFR